MPKTVNVIGAGLAGSEAAYQLAKFGFKVNLFEMRPHTMTPAHVSGDVAELVCTNSFRSNSLSNAAGLLKEEMRLCDSVIMKAADAAQIPAGSALAVDRKVFSKKVKDMLMKFPNIHFINQEVVDIDINIPTIIATGPLTSDALSKSIQSLIQSDSLYFYDAVAPIVDVEGIDFDICYRKSRYDKGEGQDYINCPMTKEEFDAFYDEILKAELAPMREFEDVKVFEACMPIETMAKRGYKTMTFGPLKPVGLEKPDGTRPYAVVQLRQDNAAGTLYNLVGFQTRMTWSDQKRIIKMIPSLKDVEIVRYGVMHRNTFINAPTHLNHHYQMKEVPNVFFAGQITGVEGYLESASSGLVAALNMVQYLNNEPMQSPPTITAMGALAHYTSHANPHRYQPMNVNFGLFEDRLKDREEMAKRSLKAINNYYENIS